MHHQAFQKINLTMAPAEGKPKITVSQEGIAQPRMENVQMFSHRGDKASVHEAQISE